MISRELLKLVLPYPQNEFVDFIKQNDEFIKYGARVQDQISIYELAFKCKLWAITKNVYICSFSNVNGGVADVYNGFSELLFESRSLANSERQTESEAIFKTCEWILKEINK